MDFSSISFSHSPLSLLPPVLAVVLAIVTRRALLSLSIGIALGALFLNGFNPLTAARYIGREVLGLFWDNGIKFDKVFIVTFSLTLGIITSFASLSGGDRAFSRWARQRIKTAKGSQLLAVFLGIIVFIDDYFNALAVGNVCRPVTDAHGVSRAKLAYLIDSTAAPVCVLAPVSSWGAYIVTLTGTTMAAHGVQGMGSLIAFVSMIPMNFYALFALFMAAAVAAFELDIGPMAKHARIAREALARGGDQAADVVDSQGEGQGKVFDLVGPILALVVVTLIALVGIGAQALAEAGRPFSFLAAIESTRVPLSLVLGGCAALLVSAKVLWRQRIAAAKVGRAALNGISSMIGCSCLLVISWTLVTVVDHLETGAYLISFMGDHMDAGWLPLLVFLFSGVVAFFTGTSWGTFALMLPIAADMAYAADSALLLPAMAAVLSGAVFGDHCSPISDTTILSSTGASCDHIDHVVTQLPYCLLVACICCVGYLMFGMSGSLWAGLAATTGLFILSLLVMKKLSVRQAGGDKSLVDYA
ncbi:MAG: Na+/H+ antiporter NhaC family protein [Kistimonas sp.]|nr:Na+/H+ antiporter NhaC family protein [Kistimonas sp.]